MGILSITTDVVGQINVNPRRVKIVTTDSNATITTANYLNKATLMENQIYQTDVFDIIYDYNVSTGAGTYDVYTCTISNGIITLVPDVASGNVQLPVTASHIATYVGTTGLIGDDAATAINGGNIQAGLSGTAGYLASFPGTAAKGSLRVTAVANTGDTLVTVSNAAHGQASVISIPDGGQATSNFIISNSAGTQTIATGNLSVAAGNISAGASGAAGTLASFPSTAANGSLIISALNAGGAFNTTIRNSVMGQSSVVSIPDPGAATANFLLDTGASNILAKQQFVGLSNVLTFGTGTWTVTRIAQGNYVSRHTPADETSIIGVDITPIIRVAAAKGWRLDSFDVVYAIAANALDAHSVTLDRIAYANNVAVSVTNIPVTGVLATAVQANPYLTNVVVDTPAFDVTADSKYIIEVTVDNAAASEYDYYGIMLRFSETIA